MDLIARLEWISLEMDIDDCSSFGFIKEYAICTVLLFILPICCYGLLTAKLVIGCIYVHRCALQPFLPVFLILHPICSAVFTLLLRLVEIINEKKRQRSAKLWWHLYGACHTVWLVCGGSMLWWHLYGACHTVWLVCGTISVVGVRDTIYAPGHCDNSTDSFIEVNATVQIVVGGSEACVTCSEVLTDFTFFTVIVEWALVGLHVLMWCTSCVVMCTSLADMV